MWVLSRAHLYTEVYPKLYWGLGRIKESYKIRLRENAVPYAVSAPRRAPLPLQKKKVKMELKHLEDLDVIHQVRTPTDWCAPIAVVPKEKKRRYPVVCRPDKAG